MTESPPTMVGKDPSSIPPVAFSASGHPEIGDELKRLYGSSSPTEQANVPAKRVRRERSHVEHHHPEQSAVTTKTYELAVGMEIPVRVEEAIDSARAAEGQTYAAEVTSDVRDDAGDVVIPSGANAQIVIRSASKGGRVRGSSDLVLD